MAHPLTQTPEYRRLAERCRQARISLEFAREIPYGIQLWARRGGQEISVNLYKGKKGVTVVVQGAGPLRDEIEARPAPEMPWRVWVGSDESGKGDFFGPLVVAAVRVEASKVGRLAEWGVKDCKVLSDQVVDALDARIRPAFAHAVQVLDPEAYNERHRLQRNLNRILVDEHAAAIKSLLAPNVDAALVDQFAPQAYLKAALKGVTLVQRHKAESDPAVAAASVVARAEFLRRLRALSDAFGIDLPKGAAPQVIVAGRRFVALHGREALGRVAKLHFKTTLSV